MEKEAKQFHCRCKNHCGNRRCACLKHNEPCDEHCGCQDCHNPLQGVDVKHLTVCAIQNIATVKALTEDELNREYLLDCEHERVPL